MRLINFQSFFVIRRMRSIRSIILIDILILIFILITYFYICWNNNKTLFTNELNKNNILNKVLLQNDRNIFFLETSCVLQRDNLSDGLHLTSRQACAVYSTAKMNPSRPVILYHSCPLHPNYYEKSSEGNKHLLKLPNVFLLNLKYYDILRGSLVENIIDDIKSSQYPVEHASDALRLVLLYKYGGAYMDLDFISIRSLDSLPKNVLSPESLYQLSNGFFQFDHEGKGNEFLKEVLTGLSKHFKKYRFNDNGPAIINKAFMKFCNIIEGVPFTQQPCEISVCNTTMFYPIYLRNWKLLFSPMANEFVLKQLNNSIAVHFWSHMSKNERIIKGGNSVYEILFRQYCPDIFKSAQDLF